MDNNELSPEAFRRQRAAAKAAAEHTRNAGGSPASRRGSQAGSHSQASGKPAPPPRFTLPPRAPPSRAASVAGGDNLTDTILDPDLEYPLVHNAGPAGETPAQPWGSNGRLPSISENPSNPPSGPRGANASLPSGPSGSYAVDVGLDLPHNETLPCCRCWRKQTDGKGNSMFHACVKNPGSNKCTWCTQVKHSCWPVSYLRCPC
jgi:hypothetical protein